MSKQGVLVLGDSHAKGFFAHGNRPYGASEDITIYGQAITGATVTGIGRLRSALDVNKRVRALIEQHLANCRHVVFAFGQVDVELGLYYRWVVKDEMVEPEVLFTEIVAQYIRNIKEMSQGITPLIKGINQTVLIRQNHAIRYTSRILLENEADQSPLTARLRAVYPSYDVRLYISNLFNEVLAKAAAAAGIGYFDINAAIVDKETGEVKDAYCPNFSDHHIVNSVQAHRIHIAHLLAATGRSQP